LGGIIGKKKKENNGAFASVRWIIRIRQLFNIRMNEEDLAEID
jgi:hypothetical protein